MHRSSIQYPDAARAKRVQGVVTLEATIDAGGNVVDTRVLSGPVELRRAAQQSVLNWHFAMDTSMNTRMVKVNFELPAQSAQTATMPAPGAPMDSASRAAVEAKLHAVRSQMELQARQAQDPATRQQTMQKMLELQSAANLLQSQLGPPSLEGKRVGRIFIGGLSDQSRSELMAHLQIHVGDTLEADSLAKARAETRQFDEHLNFGTSASPNGDVTLVIQMPGSAGYGEVGVTSTPIIPPAADGTKRITIGGNVQQAKLISQARPAYPPLAKQARISGVVHLSALIGKEGNVANLAVISGHPLLIPSALEAVQKWVYQKTLLNGEPVEVMTQIDVNYTLSDEPPVQQ
jgi:TonB family protein